MTQGNLPYFSRYGCGGFPVISSEGKYLGIITLKEVKKVPRDALKDTRVSEAYAIHRKEWEISEAYV